MKHFPRVSSGPWPPPEIATVIISIVSRGKKKGGSERKVASLRSHSQRVVELGFDLKFSATVLLYLREVVLGFPGGRGG